MGYKATIYSDDSFTDGNSTIHTWIELTDDNGNKSVYSYNPVNQTPGEVARSLGTPVPGGFNSGDESEGRKASSTNLNQN